LNGMGKNLPRRGGRVEGKKTELKFGCGGKKMCDPFGLTKGGCRKGEVVKRGGNWDKVSSSGKIVKRGLVKGERRKKRGTKKINGVKKSVERGTKA